MASASAAASEPTVRTRRRSPSARWRRPIRPCRRSSATRTSPPWRARCGRHRRRCAATWRSGAWTCPSSSRRSATSPPGPICPTARGSTRPCSAANPPPMPCSTATAWRCSPNWRRTGCACGCSPASNCSPATGLSPACMRRTGCRAATPRLPSPPPAPRSRAANARRWRWRAPAGAACRWSSRPAISPGCRRCKAARRRAMRRRPPARTSTSRPGC